MQESDVRALLPGSGDIQVMLNQAMDAGVEFDDLGESLLNQLIDWIADSDEDEFDEVTEDDDEIEVVGDFPSTLGDEAYIEENADPDESNLRGSDNG